MPEDVICVGDIFAEIERAELLEAEIGDEITTFTTVCHASSVVCC